MMRVFSLVLILWFFVFLLPPVASASPEFSQSFPAANPHVRWLRDDSGASHAAVLEPGTARMILQVTVHPDGGTERTPAAIVTDAYQFVGSRIVLTGGESMKILVHLRKDNRAYLYIIDAAGPLEQLESHPVLNLSASHEFRDWHGAAGPNQELLIVMTGSAAAFGGAREILLFCEQDLSEPRTAVSVPGYAADPRLIPFSDSMLLFWREGGRTDRSDLVWALVDVTDPGEVYELFREPGGLSFSSSIGLSFTQAPGEYLPRIRDPGPVFFKGEQDMLYMVFQHIQQARTELTMPITFLELRSYRLEGSVPRMVPMDAAALTEPEVSSFTYPGESPVWSQGVLQVPYMYEQFRGSVPVSDFMVSRFDPADSSVQLLALTASPRHISSAGIGGGEDDRIYFWVQQDLDGLHQVGILKDIPAGYESSFPAVLWGDRTETFISSLVTFMSAVLWALTVGTLQALPGLLVFWLFLLAAARRRPGLLHRFAPWTVFGGSLFCISLLAAAADIHPGGTWAIAAGFIVSACSFLYAKQFLPVSTGYTRILKLVWASVILYVSLGAWPKVFSGLARFMHYQ